MRPLRSVGTQLSLALLLVVAVALGIVYLTVVPSLEDRLVDSRVSDVEQTALGLQKVVPDDAIYDPDFVLTASEREGARVALLFKVTNPTNLLVRQDSGQIASDIENDPLAERALDNSEPRQGVVETAGVHYAEAAVPVLGGDYVLLVRKSIEDQYGSVSLVERRVLLAAAAALAMALLLGYGGARMFARRIRRLERAADRIASGRFDEPVVDTGGGELGALADAFERMRVRLAHLDDARRAFVANASHELRTPLFSLGGFLELLDEEPDEETRREFLGSMREQVVRLTKLAEALLDLSRLDAGRLTVEREPVDLANLARDLVEEFRPVATSTEHELTADAVEPVVADADELRALQLGRILVENALLHTPPGTAVRVRTRAREGEAILEVEDAGSGIPTDQHEQLFERFTRLDGTRASGSGLGLAIAKELAELMDGGIEVESKPGRTVFTLALPKAVAVSREAEAVLP